MAARVSRLKKWVRKQLAFAALAVVAVGLFAVGVAWLWFSRNLPSVADLRADSFPTVTEVYDDNGEVIGEFYDQRRYVLSYDRIPKGMIDAILSAEDADFFNHGGVDLTGIVRAAWKDATAGEVQQGASTITMQLAKALLPPNLDRWSRKAKQIILAKRLEKNFQKEEILDLYLNVVFFGRGAYGVEAASREYFGKHLEDLDAAQYAMIASLPKEPSVLAAPDHFPRWKERQEWVLDREAKLGKLTQAQADAAKKESIVLAQHQDPNLETAPYFVEYIRQQLEKTYGDDALLRGGLKVFTTADGRMSRAAMDSLRHGLRDLDKHQGWRGPLETKDRKDWPATMADLDGKRGPFKGKPIDTSERIKGLVVEVDTGKGRATIAYGADEKEKGTLLLRDCSWGRVPDPNKAWYEDDAEVTNIGKVVKPGDVVWIQKKVPDADETKSKVYAEGEFVTLEQEPAVQGAVFAMDPQSGAVKVMVGGYDFEQSKFNRAIQSRRQPGSAFKPVIYASAIDTGRYNPSTIIQDAPLVYGNAPDPGKAENEEVGPDGKDKKDDIWKPKNYGDKYYGDTTFRTALVLSRNVCTIRIVEDIGIDYVAEYAKNLGFSKEPNHDLTIALGSSDTSLAELSQIYATFPAGGKKVDPFFIRRVVARDGSVLEQDAPGALVDRDAADLALVAGREASRAPAFQTHYDASYAEGQRPATIDDQRDAILRGHGLPQGYVMDPETAYVMVDLMKHVVLYGTGIGAQIAGRPIAGKTGTTNDEGDVWFMGYTPDLVAGVWVGFDDESKKLGKGETGGHSAVPIWHDFMEQALKTVPARDFPMPNDGRGLVRVLIDRQTGLLACANTDEPVYMTFKDGTQPTQSVCQGGVASPLQGMTTTNGTGVGSVPSGLPPE